MNVDADAITSKMSILAEGGYVGAVPLAIMQHGPRSKAMLRIKKTWITLCVEHQWYSARRTGPIRKYCKENMGWMTTHAIALNGQ